jgi:hypothetical protein
MSVVHDKLFAFITGFIHFPPDCESADSWVFARLDAKCEQKDA